MNTHMLYALLISSLLISPAQKATNLIGTWAGCNDYGEYVEIHFSEYECLSVNSEIIDFSYSTSYSVRGNEIHYTNQRLGKNLIDTFSIDKGLLTLKSNFFTFEEFRRISDFPLVSPSIRALKKSSLDTIQFFNYKRLYYFRETDYKCQ